MNEPADCCSPHPAPSPAPAKSPASAWLGVGALVAALLASACCWLPLLLIALGASAAGAGAVFDRWRPVLLAVMVALLGLGYWFAYRPQPCAPGSACATVPPRRQRSARIALWVATGITLVTAAFPWYAPHLLPAARPQPVAVAHGTPHTLTIAITGMTCVACTVQVQRELAQVPGVLSAAVTLDPSQARIVWDGDQTNAAVLTQAAHAAIRAAGYAIDSAPPATAPAHACCTP